MTWIAQFIMWGTVILGLLLFWGLTIRPALVASGWADLDEHEGLIPGPKLIAWQRRHLAQAQRRQRVRRIGPVAALFYVKQIARAPTRRKPVRADTDAVEPIREPCAEPIREPAPNQFGTERERDIIALAKMRNESGNWRMSANAIAELFGGTRADVLALVRQARANQPQSQTSRLERPADGW